MLATQYAQNNNWYQPYVDEIFTGIGVNDLEVDINILLDTPGDQILRFSVEYCNRAYFKLLETNQKNDINIYLTALKIAAYHPDLVINHIYNKVPDYFLQRPVLMMILFSRGNVTDYPVIRKIYDEWHADI